jgi:uncharacterized SAM-binding protein YcdF (DUF218 family)
MTRMIVSLLLLVVLLNPFTLAWLASRYVVDDGLERADVVVALRGGQEESLLRAEEAARLLGKGYAPLLMLDVYDIPVFGHPEGQLAADYFKRKGISARQMRFCESHADSTAEEAAALRLCLERIGAKKVLVVTSEFHTRRARSILRHAFSGSSIAVGVHPLYVPEYWDSHWWRKRRWAKTFFDETVRTIWTAIEQGTYWIKHSLSQNAPVPETASEPRHSGSGP